MREAQPITTPTSSVTSNREATMNTLVIYSVARSLQTLSTRYLNRKTMTALGIDISTAQMIKFCEARVLEKSSDADLQKAWQPFMAALSEPISQLDRVDGHAYPLKAVFALV